MSSLDQAARFIGIKLKDSSLFDHAMVRSFSFREELSRLFELEVDLASENGAIKFDDVVGGNATVWLELAGGKKRYFNGCVSRFTQTESPDQYARYRLVLVPWLWLLTRAADCRFFPNIKVPDIVEKVFKGHGFSDYELRLTGSYGEWEHCVQYRETDFNFVSRLMEQEGIYYFFEHTDGAHKLILGDSASAHSAFGDYDHLHYHPAEDSGEWVSEWVMEKELQPGAYALRDFNFTIPKAGLAGNASITRDHKAADFEIFDYPGEFEQSTEGTPYAQIRIEELQVQHEVLGARTTARGVCAGSKFKLKAHPRQEQNRDYLVTGASLQASAGYLSGGTDSFACDFAAIPFDQQFRPARTTRKPLIRGPQTAIVVGKAGEEIETDKYGRVKVQFHWDREHKMDENSSCWVRVSQVWAGKQWGAIHIPRIGQEVIVEFLEGDPDLPIITGRVYNDDNKPPYELPANKTQSGIKSRSSKQGTTENFNEIRFEDKKGSEEVYIHAEKDKKVVVENDRTESVGHNESITVGNDRTESVGNNENITIKKDRKESVGKNESISIGENRTESVGKEENITIGGGRTENVAKNENISIGENREETVGKDQKLQVTGSRTEEIGKDDKQQVGKKFALVAGEEILLQTGDASITMKKDGTIAIKGKDVTIQGSGKINVKASKDVTIKGSKVTQN